LLASGKRQQLAGQGGTALAGGTDVVQPAQAVFQWRPALQVALQEAGAGENLCGVGR